MKKLIVLGALAAMAVACGGSDVKAEDPSTTTTTSEPSKESTDKNAPASSAAPADTTAAPASTATPAK